MKYLLFTFLILVFYAMHAQETKVTWDYPVKPDMEEWMQLKTFEEMYQACQIPDEIIKRLDTESLVQICFDFPFFKVLFLYNSLQDGFNSFYKSFNGIHELLDRKDAGYFMLKKYASMSVVDFNPLWSLGDQGGYIYKYKYFETLLAQPQVVESLGRNGRKNLLEESIKKFDMKLSNMDLFGGSSLVMIGWVMARVLHYENRLSSIDSPNQAIESFLASRHLVDYDLMYIYEQSRIYIHEN